ncbi:MAG: hypothetical protein OXU68_15640 [Bacteroidota bacterium]|nr:hypothetical protein [Bacteroidota bacterium]MDE2958417.1 hypothetical protein [Bacteroidota bacterium]
MLKPVGRFARIIDATWTRLMAAMIMRISEHVERSIGGISSRNQMDRL